MWLICGSFVTISIFLSGLLFFKKKIAHKKILIILIILGIILNTSLNYFEIRYLSSFLFLIYYPVLFKIAVSTTFKESLHLALILWIFGMLIDMVIMLIMSLVNFLYNLENIVSIYTVTATTVISSVIFLIIPHLSIFKKLYNYLYNLLKNLKFIDYLFGIIVLFMILSMIFLDNNLFSLSKSVIILIYIILILSLLCLILYIKNVVYSYKLFIDNVNENIDYYLKEIDDYHTFKHNIRNKLISIKTKINKDSQKFVDNLINSITDGKRFYIMKNVPYGIEGVIYQKVHLYEKKLNIKIENQLDKDILSNIKPSTYNLLCENLAIVLDNAVEAAVKSNDKIILLSIYEKNNRIVLDVVNSFNESVDIDLLGCKNYSTKKLGHGYGLFSILKNRKLKVHFSIINGKFVSKLEIQLNKGCNEIK